MDPVSARLEAAHEAFVRLAETLTGEGPTTDAQEDQVARDAVLVVGNTLLSIAESLEILAAKTDG